MNTRKYVRRHYIVNRNFQYRFIVRAMMITIFSFVAAFIAIVLYFYFEYGLRNMFENKIFIQVSKGVKVESIATPFQMIIPPFIISAVVVLVAVFLFSMIYSNRLAGPIYRFKVVLEFFKVGNYNIDVVLRKRDEFKDLAEELNLYSRIMREKKYAGRDLH